MKKIGLLAAASMLSLGGTLAATMRAFDSEMPAFAGHAPNYRRVSLERDGLGRRIKPKRHPKHNANKQFTREFADFRKRVMATHRDLPNGARQADPRDDKYLHSHARQMRALHRMLAA